MPGLKGTTLKDRYRIDELIGRANPPDLVQAWDDLRQHPMAIRLMREKLAIVRRFKRKAGAPAAMHRS